MVYKIKVKKNKKNLNLVRLYGRDVATRNENITFCFITVAIKIAELASWKKIIDTSRTAMDMTKKQVMHTNELHGTKFHNQANLKKFVLALIINVIFCEKFGGVSTTPSFKKK
jgi:hypothetical protein